MAMQKYQAIALWWKMILAFGWFLRSSPDLSFETEMSKVLLNENALWLYATYWELSTESLPPVVELILSATDPETMTPKVAQQNNRLIDTKRKYGRATYWNLQE